MTGRGPVPFFLLGCLTIMALVAGCAPGAPGVPSVSPAATVLPSPSSDLDGARQALVAFFSLLHDHRYSEAANYYGGSYEVLRGWNPSVAPDQAATLLEQGCTVNGLTCLPIGRVVSEARLSPTEFTFTVEFSNDDGTLFVLGPCCGATEAEMPPQTQFAYTVRGTSDGFRVQDLPVYVP